MRGQRGFGVFDTCIISLFVLVIGWTSYALVPIFFEHLSIKRTIRGLEHQASLMDKSKRHWVRALQKQFDLNNIHRIKADDLSYFIEEKRAIISYNYNVKTKYLLNVDFWVDFHDEIEVVL